MKTRLLIGFLLLCLFFQFSSFKSVNSQTDYQNSESMPVIQMAVFVDAVDVTQKTANLHFVAFIFNVPHNKSTIEIYLASIAEIKKA